MRSSILSSIKSPILGVPQGVNSLQPELIGTIIELQSGDFIADNFVDNSDVGTTFAFNTTQVDFSSVDTTVEFTDYMTITPAAAGIHEYTSWEQWKITAHLTLDNVDSTSFGLSFGTRGASTAENFFNHVRVALDSSGNNGLPYQYDDSGFSRQKVGTQIAAFAGAQDLWYEIERRYDQYYVSVYQNDSGAIGTQIGTTQNISPTTQYDDAATIFRYPISGRWACYYFGQGVMTLDYWKIEVLAYKNVEWLVMGDSNTQGTRTVLASRYTELMKASLGLDDDQLTTMVGFGQRVNDFNNVRQQIALVNPKNIIINMGSNDVAANNVNLTTQYDTLVDNIITDLPNCNVYLCTPIARNGVNFTTFNSYIVTKAASIGTPVIDLYATTQDGGNLNAAYNSGDNIHMIAAGHAACNTTIINTVT